MITAIIMIYDNGCADRTIEQAKSLAEDIIILKVQHEGYAIEDYKSGRTYAEGTDAKGYGELVSECMSYAEGECVLFLKEGEAIELSESALKLQEGTDSWYADIYEVRFQGRVRCREKRVFKKGLRLKGEYRLESGCEAGESGLVINAGSGSEKEYIKGNTNLYTCSPQEAYLYADCCYSLGKYTEAARLYKEMYLSGEYVPSGELYRDMCWAFISDEAFQDALSAAERGKAEFPKFKELCYAEGYIYYELGAMDRCICSLKKIWEEPCTAGNGSLQGYRDIEGYSLLAKAFYSMEDYKAAAYYYERCCLEKPDEKYAVSLCSCLYMEGYCKEVTEDYLAKKISLSPDKVNEIMIGFYRKIKSWSKLQECAERLSGSKAGEVLSESLYHMHSYDRCLEEILKSGIIETDHYAVMGLCCMLMDGSISCENRREYIIRLKTKKLTELIRAYEHISENKKHSCSRKLLEEFADVLIESGDSRCIKYVRKVLNENAVIDYMGLLEKGFGSKLYYFCEEIITIYYSRSRYEYEVLRMLSYIYYYMEKFEECERYISYALVMKKSTDLIKLGCMCNLKECRELINSYEGSKNARSIQSLSRDIEKYEKILPILLCV